MHTIKLIRLFGQSLRRKFLAQTFWIFILVSSLILHEVSSHSDKAVDNEFAEFEEFDDKPTENFIDVEQLEPREQETFNAEFDNSNVGDQDDGEDAIVEEEFDGDVFDVIDDDDVSEDSVKQDAKQGFKPLQFADVPAHLRNNWSNYQVELMMIVGLVIYLVNYIIGKQTDNNISTRWFELHADILNEQFSLVGDDGSDEALQGHAQLIRDTDSTIKLHCTGRQGVFVMLIQLKLIKRQDLFSLIMQLVRPKQDHVAIRVELEPNEMDSYVFAVGQRKSVQKLARELTDLTQYTSEKKNAAQLGLPASYTVFSEIAEATQSMIDQRVVNTLNKCEKYVEYLHLSDQYSGLKPQEGDQPAKLPEFSQVIVLGYNLPSKFATDDMEAESVLPLMNLVFYIVEKARRFRLSREGKAKAEKNRKDAQESFLKVTHAQRAEAAAARREEKIRERKQRLMEEEDPEKQRRLEKIEQKREAKKKQPRMKQLKVKSG